MQVVLRTTLFVAVWPTVLPAAAVAGQSGEERRPPVQSSDAAADRSGRQPLPSPILHALGDSTAAGVGARSGSYVDRLVSRLAQQGRVYRLVNLAESGATTSDLLRGQLSRVSAGARGLVVVSVGVNDLTRNLPPQAFARQFEALIVGIRARTSAPVVLSNLPDISLARAVWPELRPAVAARVDAYNRAIERIARQHGLAVFDVCAMTRQELPRHPEYLSADGFHPSDQGHQAWADGLWQVVQRIL
jgi:lysophospholipase L1-like esterase